jgi:hypothetical protein
VLYFRWKSVMIQVPCANNPFLDHFNDRRNSVRTSTAISPRATDTRGCVPAVQIVATPTAGRKRKSSPHYAGDIDRSIHSITHLSLHDRLRLLEV